MIPLTMLPYFASLQKDIIKPCDNKIEINPNIHQLLLFIANNIAVTTKHKKAPNHIKPNGLDITCVSCLTSANPKALTKPGKWIMA